MYMPWFSQAAKEQLKFYTVRQRLCTIDRGAAVEKEREGERGRMCE